MATGRDWLLDDSPSSRLQARLGRSYRLSRALARNPLAMVGAVIVLTLILVALFAPWIATHSPVGQDLAMRLKPPSWDNWMGTDELGRDIWSRVVYGARITLMIVALVAVLAAPVGLIIGAVAGYFGGWVDRILMGITDIFLSMPKLILALAFVAALGPGIQNAIIAIAIATWPGYARIARAETLTIRNSEFVAAVELQGASSFRVIVNHILPLCTSSMIIRVTLDMAGIILTAAGLGFIGLGAQPPLPEWGAMISRGRSFILDQWWVATMPGFAIVIVSLGFCFLGDGLRDVLDPKHGDRQ
ncbi:ABC transporter permease [Aminobacter sp. NyZ550]|jgi:peptide/nickel transport system permease protein|uniref:Cytochrome C550 n=2 Tax=Aminobacter TaxID=31988 RepID=A0AAC9AS53_AMIAI|nr:MULTISPECIES: ABC transporter permease [Aminobacter]AMS42916.1 cytochrome C550 [Aminobacter aminovorans]MBA8905838.1 peptide/nickel transport system permease protein [Aminobacter ciceronei]MBA9019617.1 peptide/nickel transport system permease protein [Aminobacter ciceronei]MBB3704766.1 peptide/nickel transport system permease protein [Aminobacter aminovorans]MRX34235.1 ABC transporter permease subunit [Aminobacter sp. MDW-2]